MPQRLSSACRSWVTSGAQPPHDVAARVAFFCPVFADCERSDQGPGYTLDDAPDSVPNPKQGDVYTASAWIKAETARELAAAGPDFTVCDVKIPVQISGGAPPPASAPPADAPAADAPPTPAAQ